jgi:putative nucleotidyltransferase with HDIG domain
LPVLVVELLNSFEQEDLSAGELARKVSQDQALSAKTLRLANSSFYGLSRKVTTIQQAITILGFDSVRTLIAAAALTDAFAGNKHAAFDFNGFWRHSIGTAVCAKLLARAAGLNQSIAFISGLLHDIGILVLVTRFPQQYSAAMNYRLTNDCYMIEAERAVLGPDHCIVGRTLAEHWKFPVLMQRAIANHHAPNVEDLGDVPGLIHLADAITHALDFAGLEDDLVPVISENAWNSLELEPALLQTVFRETEAEFEEMCLILASSSTR